MNRLGMMLAATAVFAASVACAEPPGARRDTFLQRQAFEEMQRVSGQVDVLQSNQEELAAKVRELARANGSSDGEIETLKAEIGGLKVQIASLRSEMQAMRGEIVKELTGKIQQIARQMTPPAPPPQPMRPQASGRFREYVVRPGDTLSIIAEACGTKVSAIKEANGLRSDMLRVGQKLKIPQ